ncbi:hypothetical protein NBRC10512_004427 [Rhodotorula toruloides]|uniref:RHTO0S15e03048g1_1 n=2 Tax=Rhodotorula toruloides TaxID=5286 RepID=A0A061BLD5_RHOTO|nr:uncharacterized protein RHTO_03171 [Rhodotorula toruloides NP11]EMS25442.1 hypothetical protein RHTO_03171 [Rhodotorula toruloides NP11]CDR47871.1 RHTO0S15e03048g1_1 [Rhodotorula toruloides]
MSEHRPSGGEEGLDLAKGTDVLAARAEGVTAVGDVEADVREGTDTAMADGPDVAPYPAFTSHRGDIDAAASSSVAPTASGSSTESDAAPAAAQPRRPVTPPPKSRTQPSSSGSSSDTIIVATQNATLSPPKSTFNLTQTEVAEDSPDPLRIIAVPSASSAARSTTSRARSVSVDPVTDRLQSSPTANYKRQRSKTPITVDRTGENLDPRTASRASSVSLSGAGKQRAMSFLAEDDESEDELALVPVASAMRRKGSTSNSVFVGVEIPVGRTSASMSRTASASSTSRVGTTASPAPGPALGVASGSKNADSRKKGKGRVEHSFELVIEQPVRKSRPSIDSSATSSATSRPSSPKPSPLDNAPEPTASTSSAAPPTHPLSQSLDAGHPVPPSSPLSSLPPSQLDRTSPPLPSGVSTRPKRARRSLVPAQDEAALDEALASEEDETASSSTVSNPSPKKKPKRLAPTVKKARGRPSQGQDVEPEPNSERPASRARGKGKKAAYAHVDSDDEDIAEPPKPTSQAKGRRKSELLTPVREAAAATNRNPRRRQSTRTNLKEASSSSSSESEVFVGPSSAADKPAPPTPKKRGRPPKQDAEASPTKKSKGKQPAEAEPEPMSSPSKSLLPPPSSFASQLLGHERALVESSADRAKGWSLNALPRGKPIWVHIRKDGAENGFWWPGEVDGSLWRKPLHVKLYLDPTSSILSFSPEVVTFDNPTHEDVATFRNPSRLRFDTASFRDSTDATDGTPCDEVFNGILEYAIQRDSQFDFEDDDEDEEDLLPPSSLGRNSSAAAGPSSQRNGKAKSAKRRGRKSAANASSSSDAGLDPPAGIQESSEEEDFMLEGGEDDGFDFPQYCLAKAQRVWWPARCTGYTPPSPSKSGKAKGKFTIEWTDGKSTKIARSSLLLPREPKFFTVPLGDTELKLNAKYIKNLRRFVAEDMLPVYERIINEQHPFAQAFNDDFFAGGQRRERLAKKSVFGELNEDLLDDMRDAISRWATGAGGAERPKGSARYEALTDSERARYRADVLLPIAIIENYVDDDNLVDEAVKELKKEGIAAPGEEAAKSRACEIAQKHLDSRSVTYTVMTIRQSKTRR